MQCFQTADCISSGLKLSSRGIVFTVDIKGAIWNAFQCGIHNFKSGLFFKKNQSTGVVQYIDVYKNDGTYGIYFSLLFKWGTPATLHLKISLPVIVRTIQPVKAVV